MNQRLDAGINFLIASGYTGQTTEVLAVGNQIDPFEQVTGVRLPSYVTASLHIISGRTKAIEISHLHLAMSLTSTQRTSPHKWSKAGWSLL